MSAKGISLSHELMDKIETLKIKRGTSRSETVRFIIGEYFSTGGIKEIVDELERVKLQNSQLKYQVEDLSSTIKKLHVEVMSVLLIIGGQDQKTQERIKQKFPHFWSR